MMAYLFVKRGENCEIHGAECAELPAELVAKQTELSAAGYELSSPEEYAAQLLGASTNGMVGQAELDACAAKLAVAEAKLEKLKEILAQE